MIQNNISLKAYNTFGIDAKTRFFCEIFTLEDLRAIIAQPRFREMPKLILGEGSNILLTGDFPGLAVKIRLSGIEKIAEDDEHVWISAGAGENWHRLVLYCLDRHYAGVENLSLIPGTVGAAPMQNIGAYGVEMTQVFDCLTAIKLSDGSVQVFKHADCHFGYRESVFKNQLKNQYVILSVVLRLNKKPQFHLDYGNLREVLAEEPQKALCIKKISDAVIKIRSRKLPDPKIIGNAGSFFKNPIIDETQFQRLKTLHPDMPHYRTADSHYKISAAWLIEQCHWRGKRHGNVGVHEHHALVLVNYGGGSGHAIQQLAKDIQTSVREEFSVEILPEVNIVEC